MPLISSCADKMHNVTAINNNNKHHAAKWHCKQYYAAKSLKQFGIAREDQNDRIKEVTITQHSECRVL